MKRLMDHTDTVLAESPDGFATAPADIVSLGKLARAEKIAAELTGAILDDLALPRGQPMILLANGFGATPTLELYVKANAALKVLHGPA